MPYNSETGTDFDVERVFPTYPTGGDQLSNECCNSHPAEYTQDALSKDITVDIEKPLGECSGCGNAGPVSTP